MNKQFKSWCIVYDKFEVKENVPSSEYWQTVPTVWARFTHDGYYQLLDRLKPLKELEGRYIKNYRIIPSEFNIEELEGKPPRAFISEGIE
tara:strand:+ start:1011 stop:1280 length:270 start_codon:yes stop_codon:yes gene_type:complete